VLDVASNFYEFIPEEEMEKENPKTVLAGEVEAGKQYGIVITTSSGLYRYNIGDVVRVEGFWEHAPVVTFLNKGQHTSSLTGEKLTERQVVEALTRVSGEVAGFPEHVLVSPAWGSPPRYVVTAERDSMATVEWARALGLLDARLGEVNMEYRSRRESGRLEGPTVNLVGAGYFTGMREEHLRKVGGRREQYKHVYLVPEVDFHRPSGSTGTAASEEAGVEQPC